MTICDGWTWQEVVHSLRERFLSVYLIDWGAKGAAGLQSRNRSHTSLSFVYSFRLTFNKCSVVIAAFFQGIGNIFQAFCTRVAISSILRWQSIYMISREVLRPQIMSPKCLAPLASSAFREQEMTSRGTWFWTSMWERVDIEPSPRPGLSRNNWWSMFLIKRGCKRWRFPSLPRAMLPNFKEASGDSWRLQTRSSRTFNASSLGRMPRIPLKSMETMQSLKSRKNFESTRAPSGL